MGVDIQPLFLYYYSISFIQPLMTKTSRLINRIQEKESFYDIAYLCEAFDTFIDEISEWGVDHIGGVDFDDPEVNLPMMNAFFASFGCTPDNPHPAGRYA